MHTYAIVGDHDPLPRSQDQSLGKSTKTGWFAVAVKSIHWIKIEFCASMTYSEGFHVCQLYMYLSSCELEREVISSSQWKTTRQPPSSRKLNVRRVALSCVNTKEAEEIFLMGLQFNNSTFC